MTEYILYNSMDRLPSRDEAIRFIYEESFCKRDDVGGYVEAENERYPICFVLHWPKWLDNPECPPYARNNITHLVLPPLDKRDVRYSKYVCERSKKKGLEYVAMIYMGNAYQSIDISPAIVDRRIFHRAVYFFSEQMSGLIAETPKSKLLATEEYYTKYAKFMDWPFREKLLPQDLERT